MLDWWFSTYESACQTLSNPPLDQLTHRTAFVPTAPASHILLFYFSPAHNLPFLLFSFSPSCDADLSTQSNVVVRSRICWRTRSNHGGVALVPKEAAPIKSDSCTNLASSNIFITTRKRRNYYSSGVKRFSPVMEWQHCTVKKEIDVPTSVAYQCYADREAIPNWMPFISSVKILEDKPDLSRWSLKYTAFGRDLEFAWIARNMQPILNQKIHWRSLEGLPNS